MDSRQEIALIDTNIFIIDLRYKRDIHFKSNRAFLEYIAQSKRGFTTIINLLEICGILSFNLSEKQLFELWHYFYDKYKITVLPSGDMESNFPAVKVKRIFELLKKRLSCGDALMIAVVEKHLSFISTIVTWDKDHFLGKFSGTVLTPEEYLE